MVCGSRTTSKNGNLSKHNVYASVKPPSGDESELKIMRRQQVFLMASSTVVLLEEILYPDCQRCFVSSKSCFLFNNHGISETDWIPYKGEDTGINCYKHSETCCYLAFMVCFLSLLLVSLGKRMRKLRIGFILAQRLNLIIFKVFS